MSENPLSKQLKNKTQEEYGSDNIKILKGLDPVRNAQECILAILVMGRVCIIWFLKY